MSIENLRADLVLFANDLPQYHTLHEAQAVIQAFNNSAWSDYDLPESHYMSMEMGGLPEIEQVLLSNLLEAYWERRNS